MYYNEMGCGFQRKGFLECQRRIGCFSFSKGNLFNIHTNTSGLGYISDFFAGYVGVPFAHFPSDRRLKEPE